MNLTQHEWTDLRVIGQALETLGIESFELVFDGNNFVVHGGPDLTVPRKKLQANSRLQLFRLKREKVKPQRSQFYLSGMRFRDSDVLRLDRQAKNIRSSEEKCPDTQRLSHGLRIIAAHVDSKGGTLLRVIRQNQLFTVCIRKRLVANPKKPLRNQTSMTCGCIAIRNEEIPQSAMVLLAIVFDSRPKQQRHLWITSARRSVDECRQDDVFSTLAKSPKSIFTISAAKWLGKNKAQKLLLYGREVRWSHIDAVTIWTGSGPALLNHEFAPSYGPMPFWDLTTQFASSIHRQTSPRF